MTTFGESTVAEVALAWLEGFGWQVAHGPNMTPDAQAMERIDYSEVEILAYSNEVTPMPWEGDVAAGDSGSPYAQGNTVQQRGATLLGGDLGMVDGSPSLVGSSVTDGRLSFTCSRRTESSKFCFAGGSFAQTLANPGRGPIREQAKGIKEA